MQARPGRAPAQACSPPLLFEALHTLQCDNRRVGLLVAAVKGDLRAGGGRAGGWAGRRFSCHATVAPSVGRLALRRPAAGCMRQRVGCCACPARCAPRSQSCASRGQRQASAWRVKQRPGGLRAALPQRPPCWARTPSRPLCCAPASPSATPRPALCCAPACPSAPPRPALCCAPARPSAAPWPRPSAAARPRLAPHLRLGCVLLQLVKGAGAECVRAHHGRLEALRPPGMIVLIDKSSVQFMNL